MKINRPSPEQPIPANAKLVFRGKLFDVYQWRQRMFDGSYQTFEKLKRVDTVMVVPTTSQGKIILIDEEQPGRGSFLSAVGGRVEQGESVLDTAKRELLEETGHEAYEFSLWDAVQPVSKIDWAVYTFIAKGSTKVSDPKPDAGEKITPRFVSFDEFINLVSESEFRDREITLKLLNEGFKLSGGETEVAKLKNLFFD